MYTMTSPEEGSALLLIDKHYDLYSDDELNNLQRLNSYLAYFKIRKLPIFVACELNQKESSKIKKGYEHRPEHFSINLLRENMNPELNIPSNAIFLSSDTNSYVDLHSVFDTVNSYGIQFATILLKLKVRELFVGGIASESFLIGSKIDATRLGWKLHVLPETIKVEVVSEVA